MIPVILVVNVRELEGYKLRRFQFNNHMHAIPELNTYVCLERAPFAELGMAADKCGRVTNVFHSFGSDKFCHAPVVVLDYLGDVHKLLDIGFTEG